MAQSTVILEASSSSAPVLQTGTPDFFNQVENELDRILPARSVERILLIVPPNVDEGLFNLSFARKGRYENYPAYGFGILATHLRSKGFQVDILNLHHLLLRVCRQEVVDESWDYSGFIETKIREKLAEFCPDLVGVTCMFSVSHQSTVRVCQQIKAIQPSLPIALGGVHITNSMMDPVTSEILLRDFETADFLLFFEAEIAFLKFLEVLNRQAPASQLVQIFIHGNQKFRFDAKVVPAGEDVNVYPAYDLLDLRELSGHGTIGNFFPFKERGTRFATALSNRGCRAQCTFCSVRAFNGVKVRGRSVQSVIDELLVLRHEYGIEHVMWLDDDFLYDAKRAMRLFEEMVRQDVSLTWDCSNGVIAAACTDELMQAAAKSGCIGLILGMESGNPEILRRVKKPGAVKHFLKAAEILRKIESINSRVFLMVGFPKETFGMIQDTISVAQEMNLDWHIITKLNNLPNTPLFNEAASDEREKIKKELFGNKHYASGRDALSVKNDGKFLKTSATPSSQKRFALTEPINSVFENADKNSLPTDDDLNRIWVYMHFHLNFMRILREDRQEKLRQAYIYLRYITDMAGPDNALAHYCRSQVYHKMHGVPEVSTLTTLTQLLETYPFWQDRFAELKISL